MSINKQIFISSISKSIDKAKINGILDTRIVLLYSIIDENKSNLLNNSFYIDYLDDFNDLLYNIENNNKDLICNYKAILPTSTNKVTGLPVDQMTNNPIVTDFTVNSVNKTLFKGDPTLYDVYEFNAQDFLDNYTDSNDQIFNQLRLNRIDLQGGNIKVTYDDGSFNVFGQNSNPINVELKDVALLSYYTEDTSNPTPELTFRLIDKDSNNNFLISNLGTITINRGDFTENQPPTIGDTAIFADNRVSTVLSLAMFTTGLTAPYNDPENDLIDAIRIDEISTANDGVFNYNGSPVVTGQIITREDLINELFVHLGSDENTINTDAFNFSVRDEGSQKWVK